MLSPNETRIGHIGFGDHRFRGYSVLNELIDSTDGLALTWLGISGRSLLSEERDIIRLMTLAATAADARVWPVKITRLLSAYGNAYAGFLGGQLATPSERIGAGSLERTAHTLKEFMDAIEDKGGEIDATTITPLLLKYLEKNPILNGFGVPFRDVDERLVALMKRISGHPAEKKPFWRLAAVLMTLMRELKKVEPNVGIAMGALLLDLGIPPEKAAIVCSILMMSPLFAAHALEASQPEYNHWRALSADQINYTGTPRRSLQGENLTRYRRPSVPR